MQVSNSNELFLWRSKKHVGVQIDEILLYQVYSIARSLGWRYIPGITLIVPPCPNIYRVVGDRYDYLTSTAYPDRVNGESFTRARLGAVERLTSSLHAHGALVTIWALISSGPSSRNYMCQWSSRLSHVKLAATCGARSALGPWTRTSLSTRALCP